MRSPARQIIDILVRHKVIPEGFSGQIVLHVGQGGICDVERRDRGLKKLLERESYLEEVTKNAKMG